MAVGSLITQPCRTKDVIWTGKFGKLTVILNLPGAWLADLRRKSLLLRLVGFCVSWQLASICMWPLEAGDVSQRAFEYLQAHFSSMHVIDSLFGPSWEECRSNPKFLQFKMKMKNEGQAIF